MLFVKVLGVYFELKGNRMFCAHLNVWHEEDDGQGWLMLDHDPYPTNSVNWVEVRDVVSQRMLEHSADHGWTADDYKPDTLRFVSFFPMYAAKAVVAAFLDFLKVPNMPAIRLAHGFAIKPSIASHPGIARFFAFRDTGGNWAVDPPEVESMPPDLIEVRMTDDDGIARGGGTI